MSIASEIAAECHIRNVVPEVLHNAHWDPAVRAWIFRDNSCGVFDGKYYAGNGVYLHSFKVAYRQRLMQKAGYYEQT